MTKKDEVKELEAKNNIPEAEKNHLISSENKKNILLKMWNTHFNFLEHAQPKRF
ncbi:TPA: hypothetical protein ACOIWQ_002545 [Enterococcus faecalis]|nr:hypothetical protein [Enterococcus faecalis]